MKTGYQTIGSIKNECAAFADQVLALDDSALSDEQLRQEMEQTGDEARLAALVCEVIYRKKGLRLFHCQLETAAALYRGHIAELPTGEGKTLAAVVAAVLYAKAGRRVHILVFNDYLAGRDAADNREIFAFCGISSACITEATPLAERQTAYDAQVLYIPAREAGYDCLRNFVAASPEELIGGVYDVAIVDEADSILIDEASIPLVLAGKAEAKEVDEPKILEAIASLSPEDYALDEQDKQIWLCDSGIEKLENFFLLDNLYDDKNAGLLSGINTGLQAVFLLQKDKDYIVKDGKIAVIDESTGRIAESRKFPNALHRFVEAKEGITDNINTKIYCTMTIGAFMEQYKTLSGMTGTAATSANEFETAYQLRTVVMEPHTPCIRVDQPDEVFLTDQERDEAVLAEISAAYEKGQPVLIGTASVMESERLSERLNEKNIPHQVLNARNDEREAAMIAEAGRPRCVTVSTNMAGRGVDIRLGGVSEEEKEFVASVGGLYVISTTVNRSRRIDNQLRGRAGRQGDPGESKFFISLQDENIAPFFAPDPDRRRPPSDKEKFAMVRDAQRTLEGNEAEARYTLKKYSYIIEHQRRLISDYRKKLLLGEQTADVLKEHDPDRYLELEQKIGKRGIELAETAFSLYYINYHFANYLEAMEEIKSGIHLTMVAGKNPFDEFNRCAISAFDEMNQDIRFDVLEKMRDDRITENGIDPEAFGLNGATGTWTYMVDDSAGQFNHLPALMNMFSQKIKKSLSFSERLERFFNRKNKK